LKVLAAANRTRYESS